MKVQAAAARAPAVSDVAVGTEAELEAAPPTPLAGKLDGEVG